MLKLVLGASGSGKTTLLYARIRARAEAGKRSILLVPEQFTSSTEARIYRELGDALSGMVESYSFTSLAEHILAALGGAAVQTLTDAGRAVLVRRALEELQDNVHYYYRHRRSAAFCQMAAETIDELKSAGLSGQQLQELARDCGTESAKLGELALIFQGYESLLAGTGMDPADRLELAADRLEAALARDGLPDFLREREVFIDEFDTFNAPKKRLMGAMLAALPAVTVALCEDGAPMQPGDLELFSGAKQVAAQLRQLVPGVRIVAKACPMFVPLVENGYVNDGNPVTRLIIEEYLTQVRDAGIDTLILGCTHYPLLKKMIGDFMGDSVTLIDPGKLTAIATARALEDLGLASGRRDGGTVRFFVSDTPEGFDEQERLFMGDCAGGDVEQIAIENY